MASTFLATQPTFFKKSIALNELFSEHIASVTS